MKHASCIILLFCGLVLAYAISKERHPCPLIVAIMGNRPSKRVSWGWGFRGEVGSRAPTYTNVMCCDAATHAPARHHMEDRSALTGADGGTRRSSSQGGSLGSFDQQLPFHYRIADLATFGLFLSLRPEATNERPMAR
jgi:hypothetical protein